jgi:hypothetical protein
MFSYKFAGLESEDARTPYTYGSLPAKPVLGTVLAFDETSNRYVVVRIDGQGLEGDAETSQKELAWSEIGRCEAVPTLRLQRLDSVEMKAVGRSFSYEEVKEFSQKNREIRLSV